MIIEIEDDEFPFTMGYVITPSIQRIKLSKVGFLIEHHTGSCPYGCCVSKKANVNWLNRHPNNSKKKTLRTYRDGSRKH